MEPLSFIDESLKQRFWKKVSKTQSCWEWIGSRDRKGYGRIKATRIVKSLKAHRVSYEMHYGPIPAGLSVLHTCDNSRCVRPDHLFLGTNADNVQDLLNKGRTQKGEKNSNAHLTAMDIQAIRKARANGELPREIAVRFGTSLSNVYAITTDKSWTHLSKD